MNFESYVIAQNGERDTHLKGQDLKNVLMAFHQLEFIIGKAFAGDQTKKGHYPDVPWSHHRFINSICLAQQALFFFGNHPQKFPNGYKFMDAGCGVGMKVLLAKLYGWDAYGIDINPIYHELAQGIVVDEKKDHIILGDAREHNYSKYDCIYWYNPMRGHDHMRPFEEKILTTARQGAVVISAFENNFDNKQGWHRLVPWCIKDTGNLYAKITEEEASRWDEYQKELKKKHDDAFLEATSP